MYREVCCREGNSKLTAHKNKGSRKIINILYMSTRERKRKDRKKKEEAKKRLSIIKMFPFRLIQKAEAEFACFGFKCHVCIT